MCQEIATAEEMRKIADNYTTTKKVKGMVSIRQFIHNVIIPTIKGKAETGNYYATFSFTDELNRNVTKNSSDVYELKGYITDEGIKFLEETFKEYGYICHTGFIKSREEWEVILEWGIGE